MKKKIIIFLIETLAKLVGQKTPPFSTVAAIITHNRRVLMINLTYKDGVNLPGGMVSPGENLEQALVREVKEETNLDIKEIRYVGSSTDRKGDLFTLASGFEVRIGSVAQLRGSDEGKPVWMNPEEAFRKCVYKDSQDLIRMYFGLKA